MSEFPRDELRELAMKLYQSGEWSGAYSLISTAVKRYDELAERCTMDRTESSLHIANLRSRLAEVDPEFSR